MAVLDKYANTLSAAGKKCPAINAGGSNTLVITGKYELAAGDDDGSVLRIGRLPANAIPILGQLYSDVITSCNDLDCGLYKPGVGGAVVDKDLMLDGGDPSGGKAITAPLNLLTNLGGADVIDSFGKQLWELLGLTKPSRQDYDLALTFNSVGSLAGTLSWFLLFAQG